MDGNIEQVTTALRIPQGIHDFQRIIEENFFYIDKSDLIREIWETGDQVLLLPRPRRFGKTLNMSMLYHFFELPMNGEDKKHLFEKLAIAKWSEFDSLQGKFPVLYLSFKTIRGDRWEDCYQEIEDYVSLLYERFEYLKSSLSPRESRDFEAIINREATQRTISKSLQSLTRYLHRYHKKRVIVLLDEYDTPIQRIYDKREEVEPALRFFEYFLGALFKDNDSLEKGVLTGILRLSHTSVFSDLDYLSVYSLLSPQFADKFGFTTTEVNDALKRFELASLEQEVHNWYGGYRYAEQSLYNPWSILCLLAAREFNCYWINTGSNQLFQDALQQNTIELYEKITALLNNQSVKVKFDSNFTLVDFPQSRENIRNLLLFTGYLTIAEPLENHPRNTIQLKIPNEEVRTFFKENIEPYHQINRPEPAFQKRAEGLTFNVTGNCSREKHYMVDISRKLDQVMRLIQNGEYFAINRPRQYGKTTMLGAIAEKLAIQVDEYILCDLSFEGIGDDIFNQESRFCPQFAEMLADSLKRKHPDYFEYIMSQVPEIVDFRSLSQFITRFVIETKRRVVLLIDEVDKSSNNQLFLSFLGMLRTKYLAQNKKVDNTFQSVILAGVYDIKSLKLKIREGEETKLNSPWNIAADFTVDMTFSPDEIKTMLVDYTTKNRVRVELNAVAERIFYYTSGHPFLVSRLCKNIDEEASEYNNLYDSSRWTVADVDWAFRHITRENYSTTNFEDLVKKLEDNQDLYRVVNEVIFGIKKEETSFSVLDPVLNLGVLNGIFIEKNGKTKIHNRVYEQILANYMRSRKRTRDGGYDIDVVTNDFVDAENRLNMGRILLKFQEFMKEHYSDRDDNFLEREGRLLFMSFLKPIVNGRGFMWKEPVVGDERRMDVVVTFGNNQKEVVELKIWRGEVYHQKGLKQLSGYLDFQNLTSGYLLIFDFNKNKQYTSEFLKFDNKSIHIVRV